MDLRNKKNKLSIRVVLNSCKASEEGIYSLGIRVLYRRRKKEYSLGWRLHRSNFLPDKERVVFSPEGPMKRKDLGCINRLIKEEKGNLLKAGLFLERAEPGFSLERLMQKHHKNRCSQYERYSCCNV